MPMFRKKPVVVEARRFMGGKGGKALLEWIKQGGGDAFFIKDKQIGGGSYIAYLSIKTLEGVYTATPGDWIIKGVNGEFYPCKPDIFDKTYERVKAEG